MVSMRIACNRQIEDVFRKCQEHNFLKNTSSSIRFIWNFPWWNVQAFSQKVKSEEREEVAQID